jgi:hypothetical protein
MKRVYVAGAYSASNVLQVFENMRKGIQLTIQVWQAGYAPFCPWLDYQFNISRHNEDKPNVQNFYDYSMAWLEVSNAVLVVPDSEASVGTQKEIERAKELGIPVFHTMADLMRTLNG